jgi:hypothetical protein
MAPFQWISRRPSTLMVVPWIDPVVDRSAEGDQYVELFWLNVLGPTATWSCAGWCSASTATPGYE